MPDGLRSVAQSGRADHLAELFQCDAKFLINNNIFAIRSMRHLAACRKQPAGDDLGGILAAIFQAALQGFDRGRQDEDADRLGVVAAHLESTCQSISRMMSVPALRACSTRSRGVP